MKYRRSINPIILTAMFVGLCVLAGCGMSTTTSSGNSSATRRAGIWAISGTPLDSGTVFDVTPQLASQPNGGGGAVAVWLKRIDLDPADNFPAIYHLYATHLSGGIPDANDNACPAGGFPFGNPDATGNDGVCVIDTGSAQYDAWSPKVSMDDNGDAVVVWQQHDGTTMRVYARRFSGGTWGAVQQLNDSIEFASFAAGDPAIALEPDPANNGGTDDGVGSAMAAWSQYNVKDWVQVFDSSLQAPTAKNSPSTVSGTNWNFTAPAISLQSALQTSNNAYAVYNFTAQDDLCVTGFGIVVASGTVSGIIVSVEGNGSSATPADRQYQIGLTKSGCTLAGSRKTGIQMSQAPDTGTTTGGATDAWGSSWTAAEVNAASFGVLISDNDTTAAPLNIDQITVTVITDGTPQCPGSANNLCAFVRAMAVYNNQLYAGIGGASDGAADIYTYDSSTKSWTDAYEDIDANGPDDQADFVSTMTVYNGKLFSGLGDVHPGHFFGDVRVFDGSTWTVLSTNSGAYSSVDSMAVYQCSTCGSPQLYLGMGDQNGEGDVLRCTACDGSGGDLQTVLNNPVNTYFAVTAMAVYNNQLYIGLRGVLAPNLAVVRRCSVCDGTDWQTVFTSAAYNSVRSMFVYNGKFYWGFGDSLSDGDIMRCTACDGSIGDLQTVFVAAGYPEKYEAALTMDSYNGFMYVGMGTPTISGTANHGDVLRCTVCDGTDWAYSRNDTGTYEAAASLAVYNGELYAGFGIDGTTDADIWKFSAGWQTVTRRMVNGVWDTSDTICPIGSGVSDGICYVSGVLGTAVQPTQNPRVKVDNTGRSIVAFIQMIQQSDCFVPPTVDPSNVGPGFNNYFIVTANCMVSTLEANFFDGTNWQSPIDLHPDANLSSGTPGSIASVNQLICFEAGDGGQATRGAVSNSDSCVNIVDFDITMDTTGQTFLLIKTSWGLAEDFSQANPLGGGCASGNHTGNCNPDGFADQYYQGQAIVAREYGMGSPWSAANWTLDILANFGIYPLVTPVSSTPTLFGTGPFAGGCPSSTELDVVRSILNCKFNHPRIALASNGAGFAIATYESYNGTTWDIWAHYFISPWLAGQVIDAGGGDAHAPEVAMDAAGNGVAVWTQFDGIQYRVYSNCFGASPGPGTCGNVVSAGWQGATNMDGGVGSESAYYSPVVNLAAPGGANSALSVFIGWSVLDNSTRLYSATGP